MEAFIVNVLYNPLPIFGAFLALVAAVTFLVFLRGFLSSVMYLFTLNGNDDFLLHARIRVFWAFMMLVFLYSVWQVVRWVYALLSGAPLPKTLGLAIVCFLLLFAAQWGASFIKKQGL